MTSASGLAITASSTPCTTPKTSFSLPGSPTAATSIGADRPKPVGSRYGKPQELALTQVPTIRTQPTYSADRHSGGRPRTLPATLRLLMPFGALFRNTDTCRLRTRGQPQG